MKLLARSYIVSNKKPHHRHYHTVSEWKWHMCKLLMFMYPLTYCNLSLDCAMCHDKDILQFVLDNGATICTRYRDGCIYWLRDVYSEYRRYDIISMILSYPHFHNELRKNRYNFYYQYDDIDGLRVLVKHGFTFQSRDIVCAIKNKSYNSALFMCDYTACDNFWGDYNTEMSRMSLHTAVYYIEHNADRKVEKMGRKISKKLYQNRRRIS